MYSNRAKCLSFSSDNGNIKRLIDEKCFQMHLFLNTKLCKYSVLSIWYLSSELSSCSARVYNFIKTIENDPVKL